MEGTPCGVAYVYLPTTTYYLLQVRRLRGLHLPTTYLPTTTYLLTYYRYAVCVAYVFVHPRGEKMTSNGRTFESGTIIKVHNARVFTTC